MRRFTFVFAALNLISLMAAPAEAGWPFGRRVQGYQATGCVASVGYVSPTGLYAGQAAQPVVGVIQPVVRQVSYVPQQVQQQAQATVAGAVAAAVLAGDAYGFVGMLNAARAARGLSSLYYDSGLEASASQNNAWQCVRGLGHHAMTNAGQCAAMAYDASTALGQWCASGPHAAILFDPSARTCGFALGGGYATANIGH